MANVPTRHLRQTRCPRKNESVNIVYIASSLRIGGGVNLRGRSLVRLLSTEHDLRVCGAIVQPDAPVFKDRVPDWVMSADALDKFDVVYMEGGWNDDPEAATDRGVRFSLELAESFVRRGGQLIVADVGEDAAYDQRHSLVEAVRLFGASVRFGEVGGRPAVRYLHDNCAQEEEGIRFFAGQPDPVAVQMMYVSDWLKPALEGIDSILADGAVNLRAGRGDIAASGNATTDIYVDRVWVEMGSRSPWASVNQYGRGHAVLIGAVVSDDRLVDVCPDNASWISNLIALLTERSQEMAGWLDRKSARSGAGGDPATRTQVFISGIDRPETLGHSAVCDPA